MTGFAEISSQVIQDVVGGRITAGGFALDVTFLRVMFGVELALVHIWFGLGLGLQWIGAGFALGRVWVWVALRWAWFGLKLL